MVQLFAHRGFKGIDGLIMDNSSVVINMQADSSITDLEDAYTNGFRAVEFDIWFFNQQLLLKHDQPLAEDFDRLAKLKDFLRFGNEMFYWMDFKNLNESNVEEVSKLLKDEIDKAHLDLTKFYFVPYLTDYELAEKVLIVFRQYFGNEINFVAVCDHLEPDSHTRITDFLTKNQIKFLSIDHQLIDAESIKKFSNVSLFAWTVNDENRLQELENLGVKAIATDKIIPSLKLTQAFIFAAGRGERMRPMTDYIAKPLVKIKGKSMIDYTIDKLDKITSVKKIIVNGFYLADQVKSHLAALNNSKIIFSQEVEKIETGGGLLFAKEKIDFEQPLLTINGDIIWQDPSTKSDIRRIREAWVKVDCDILLGLKKKEEFFGYEGKGDFNFDPKTGTLSKSEGEMSHVFVGVQIINPKILNSVSEKCFSMSRFYKSQEGTNVLSQKVKGVELRGKYFHVGTVKHWEELEKNMSSN